MYQRDIGQKKQLITKERKLFIGYGNGEFGFGDNITRGQVALLIQRYLKLENNLEQNGIYRYERKYV